MVEDFIHNLDVLLKHGFVEANNRLDSFSEAVDAIKITGYGLYMFRQLAFSFTYLDLVCTDTGVYGEEVSNFLVEAARKEYGLFVKNERVDRVRTRLARVERFIAYLQDEEHRERSLYSLAMPADDMFTTNCRKAFDVESERVLASANRQNASRRRRSH